MEALRYFEARKSLSTRPSMRGTPTFDKAFSAPTCCSPYPYFSRHLGPTPASTETASTNSFPQMTQVVEMNLQAAESS